MKKVLLCSILCAIMLFCATIQANAAVNPLSGDCGDGNHHMTLSRIFLGYGNCSDNSHQMIFKKVEKCKECGKITEEEEKVYASHTFVGNVYDDLGHIAGGSPQDSSHMYRFRCDCGYTETRTIPCPGTNGNHNTP